MVKFFYWGQIKRPSNIVIVPYRQHARAKRCAFRLMIDKTTPTPCQCCYQPAIPRVVDKPARNYQIAVHFENPRARHGHHCQIQRRARKDFAASGYLLPYSPNRAAPYMGRPQQKTAAENCVWQLHFLRPPPKILW